MAERLTFNYGGATKREMRDRVPLVTAPAQGNLAEAAAPFLPPVERPNWGFWGVFAFTALLFFRPQDTVRALGSLHLPDIAALAALAAMTAHRLSRNLALVRFTPDVIGVIAMGVIMVATAPFSIWPGGALGTFTDIYLKVIVIFILVVNSVRSVRALRMFTWLLIAAMGYTAARGVIDYATGTNMVDGRLYGSISGLMGNPNDLAMNLIVFLPFAAVIAIGRGRLFPRLLAGVIVVLMIATIVFTNSRAGMIGLAAVLMVLLFDARKVRPGLVVAAFVGLLAATPLLPASFWNRLSSITDQSQDETGSRQARKDLMWEGFGTFLDYPFTGVGAGQFVNYNPPGRLEPWRETHNALLQIAAELGAFGLLAFLFLIWQGVGAIRWTRRMFGPVPGRGQPADLPLGTIPVTDAFRPDEQVWMRMHASALTASLTGWFVCAQFASVGYYWTFYYMLALIVAGRELARDRFEAARKATAPPKQPAWKERLSA